MAIEGHFFGNAKTLLALGRVEARGSRAPLRRQAPVSRVAAVRPLRVITPIKQRYAVEIVGFLFLGTIPGGEGRPPHGGGDPAQILWWESGV